MQIYVKNKIIIADVSTWISIMMIENGEVMALSVNGCLKMKNNCSSFKAIACVISENVDLKEILKF